MTGIPNHYAKYTIIAKDQVHLNFNFIMIDSLILSKDNKSWLAKLESKHYLLSSILIDEAQDALNLLFEVKNCTPIQTNERKTFTGSIPKCSSQVAALNYVSTKNYHARLTETNEYGKEFIQIAIMEIGNEIQMLLDSSYQQ